MIKKIRLILICCTLFSICSNRLNAQRTLTHNSCELIKTTNHSCSSSNIYWARDFVLSEYGITTNDEYIINKGEVAISYSDWSANLQFNIYEIDDNFPTSFSTSNLIGSSQVQVLPNYSFFGDVQLVTLDFDTPVIVPANVERILVEVRKGIEYGGAVAHVAGTSEDTGVSWYRGCIAGSTYINADEIINSQWPGTGYNFYITVAGNVIDTVAPFSMNYTSDCSQTFKQFNLNNISNIASVAWDFGDPASASDNSSTLVDPTHNFSSSGTYSITANILQTDGSTYIINEIISVAQPPEANPVNDIFSCEDVMGSGISSTFDMSTIETEVLDGQTNALVSYYDHNGNPLPYPLPNPFTNTVSNIQEITVRVTDNADLCCYSETTFNLITNPSPTIPNIPDELVCDNDGNGFSEFNLSNLETTLINNQANIVVEFYDSNNVIIAAADLADYNNITINQDYITARVIDTSNGCFAETTINLMIHDVPVANPLTPLVACDDNNDGISEYFNTTDIAQMVLGNQTGMSVTYFTEAGVALPSPLPNPFTNSIPFNQNIVVRVTNITTQCYAETTLQLQTITQPSINQPNDLFACNEGDGFATFDTSSIENQLIGNQTDLVIFYTDQDGNSLASPLATMFQNTVPYTQTIFVRVEDNANPLCTSETSFNLVVNELPQINLDDTYFLCDLEPSLPLLIDAGFDTYSWVFEDGTTISNTYEATIINDGNYTVTVTESENGISCQNSFSFQLIRSVLPQIIDVNYEQLGNNYIEIIASGDGDFEYSIDGINYQDSNLFQNLAGGTYIVSVRDKDGCGEDTSEVTLVDYPNFFTPNEDGYNDSWTIQGLEKYPKANIIIFDRYGKIIKELFNGQTWDGNYRGRRMPSSEYWFSATLNTEISFRGHFSLVR